jgi:hypothetical protein
LRKAMYSSIVEFFLYRVKPLCTFHDAVTLMTMLPQIGVGRAAQQDIGLLQPWVV